MTHGGTPSVAWMSGGVARRWLEIFPAFDVEYRREKFTAFLKQVVITQGLGRGELKPFTYISITFHLKHGYVFQHLSFCMSLKLCDDHYNVSFIYLFTFNFRFDGTYPLSQNWGDEASPRPA